MEQPSLSYLNLMMTQMENRHYNIIIKNHNFSFSQAWIKISPNFERSKLAD